MIYFIKVNLMLVLLYGFYRLLVGRDTFFAWRRWMLWAVYAMALTLPMMNMAHWVASHPATVSMASAYAEVVMPAVPVYAPAAELTYGDAIRWIWLSGVIVLGARLMGQLVSICRLAAATRTERLGGMTVHVLTETSSPFSFFGWIFVNPSVLTGAQLTEVLAHEATHVRQLHSLDVVLGELAAAVCWFNPFVWLLRREVRINLEYLADEHVLAEGNARKAYQYHLLGLACHYKDGRQLANNFNVLPLKKRIAMMNKRRTREIGKGKYLLFIPLAAALAAVCNIETVARTLRAQVPVISTVAERTSMVLHMPVVAPAESPEQTAEAVNETAIPADTAANKNLSKPLPATAGKPGSVVFDVVEQMPQFPGGNGKLMEYIKSNLNYPAEAKQKGISGRVIVQFIVNEDGSISDAKVTRSIEQTLDAEALRVLKGMPAWEPGRQNGKAVRVKYNVPVSFGTDGGSFGKTQAKDSSPKPLVFIDGVEVSNLESMAPENMKSVNVLKGEAAVKKYGERAKNGVLEISTK